MQIEIVCCMPEFWHKNLSQRKMKQNMYDLIEEDYLDILWIFCVESLNG